MLLKMHNLKHAAKKGTCDAFPLFFRIFRKGKKIKYKVLKRNIMDPFYPLCTEAICPVALESFLLSLLLYFSKTANSL